MKIAILGAGSFGTALAIHLSNNFKNISIWGKNQEIIDEINIKRSNSTYLKSTIKLPQNITGTLNLEEAINNSKYIILAIPSTAIADVSRNLKQLINNSQIIVNLSKGLDKDSLERLSEIIKYNSNTKNVVVLSGPSHAEEIILNLPTTLVASSTNINLAQDVQKDFSTETLRIYTNPDIISVEIGGAAKNIIALASGILEGLNYGDNSKAALMTRGIQEIAKIGVTLGGEAHTFAGLSGIGDMIVTCTSKHSRNKQAGVLLARGYNMSQIADTIGMVVEGINACRCFYKLSIKLNVDLPINTAVYNIVFKGSEPKKEIVHLMNRDFRNEF